MRLNSNVGLAVALSAVIFVLDWFIPLGMAVGILYLLVIILVRREKPTTVVFFTVFAVFLTLLNLLIFAGPETSYLVYLNRSISVGVITLTGFFTIYRNRMEYRSGKMLNEPEVNRAYSRGIIDSVAAHIAVLNKEGNIVVVNEAWLKFAGKSSLNDLTGVDLGINYFEVCRNSAENGDETARSVLRGMKSVQGGEAESFETEYPCHSKDQKRWFYLKVSKHKDLEDHLVVVHEDISSRIIAENSLQEREQNWRQMLQNLPGYVYRCKNEENWPLTFVSEGFQKITAYDPDEISLDHEFSIGDLIEPEYREMIWNQVQKSLKDRKAFKLEYPITAKTGEQKWVWERGMGVFDDKGKLLYIEGFVSDITERKKSEEFIRRKLSMEKLHVRISEAAVGDADIPELLNFILKDLGKTMSASRVYIFEHNHSDKTMDNTYEWCDEGIIPQIDNLKDLPTEAFPGWVNKLREGKIVNIPNIEDLPDPTLKDHFRSQEILSLLVVPLFLKGEYFGFVGFDECRSHRQWDNEDIDILKSISLTITNLLERRQTEESLKEERARLDNIIKSTNLGTWEWNLQTDEVIYNHRWAEMVGYSLEELEVNSIYTWRELLHPDDLKLSDQILHDHIEGKTPFYECETRLRHKNGHWVWVLDKGKVVSYNEDGKPEWIYGTHTDITSTKLTEEQIRAKNIELEKRNTELDRFVYSTSHDLRSPLASLLGLISIAKSNTPHVNGDQKAIFKMMKKSVKRLDGFIGDILDYSRNNRQDVECESIDFEKLMQEQIEGLEHLNDLVQHKFVVSIDQNGAFFSDNRRIKVILNNLISNAVKYLDPQKPKPEVKIDINTKADKAIICIEDNGIGIKKEHQEKVFDMFYRATSFSSGSGLGLYITRESVGKLNGKINFTSKVGIGTRFVVELPDLKSVKKNETSLKRVAGGRQ
jgi:PAS domain S-box-containing protein